MSTTPEAPVTYQRLFEKYARRERDRDVISVVMGTLGIAGVVLAALRLRELQADRRAALATMMARQARRQARTAGGRS